MADMTPERLAELRAVAEAATLPAHYVCDCTGMCGGVCPNPKPVYQSIDNETVLALIDALEASNESKPSNSVTSGSANERELAELRAAAPGDDATELAITVHQLLDALEAKTAEVDDLAADPGHKAAKYWKWWQREQARADRAEAALERVKALHAPFEWSFGYEPERSCEHCASLGAEPIQSSYPCPTIRALETGAEE